jgi:DnaK suppressor protein
MLTAEQIRQFHEQVQAELASTLQELHGHASGTPVELDQTRVGRLSRMDALQQQAMAAGLRERLLLKKRRLEAALIRLDEGSFGACCQCGDAIAPERLQADPGAPFCPGCQEDISQR